MLDYQINESILNAYAESVCKHNRRSAKRLARRVNEANNTVYRVEAPITDDMDYSKKQKAAKEWRERQRREEEQLRERRARQTYISARNPDQDKFYDKYRDGVLESPSQRKQRAQLVAGGYQDPGMRIGSGVYQGLALMSGGALGAGGKVASGAGKAAKAAKAASTAARSSVLRDTVVRGLGGYGWYSAGNEVGDIFDNAGLPTAAKFARGTGAVIGTASALGKPGAPTSATRKVLFGVPGGFGIKQATQDVTSQLEKRGIITPERKGQIDRAGTLVGFGAVGTPLWEYGNKFIEDGAEKIVGGFFGGEEDENNKEETENNSNDNSSELPDDYDEKELNDWLNS